MLIYLPFDFGFILTPPDACIVFVSAEFILTNVKLSHTVAINLEVSNGAVPTLPVST